MKKPLLVTFFVLVMCAFGLYASLYAPSYLQERKRSQAHWAATLRATAPETNLLNKSANRLDRKAAELKRLGLTGKKGEPWMRQEWEAVEDEKQRVRASKYKKPFDENPLPLDLKQK